MVKTNMMMLLQVLFLPLLSAVITALPQNYGHDHLSTDVDRYKRGADYYNYQEMDTRKYKSGRGQLNDIKIDESYWAGDQNIVGRDDQENAIKVASSKWEGNQNVVNGDSEEDMYYDESLEVVDQTEKYSIMLEDYQQWLSLKSQTEKKKLNLREATFHYQNFMNWALTLKKNWDLNHYTPQDGDSLLKMFKDWKALQKGRIREKYSKLIRSFLAIIKHGEDNPSAKDTAVVVNGQMARLQLIEKFQRWLNGFKPDYPPPTLTAMETFLNFSVKFDENLNLNEQDDYVGGILYELMNWWRIEEPREYQTHIRHIHLIKKFLQYLQSGASNEGNNQKAQTEFIEPMSTPEPVIEVYSSAEDVSLKPYYGMYKEYKSWLQNVNPGYGSEDISTLKKFMTYAMDVDETMDLNNFINEDGEILLEIMEMWKIEDPDEYNEDISSVNTIKQFFKYIESGKRTKNALTIAESEEMIKPEELMEPTALFEEFMDWLSIKDSVGDRSDIKAAMKSFMVFSSDIDSSLDFNNFSDMEGEKMLKLFVTWQDNEEEFISTPSSLIEQFLRFIASQRRLINQRSKYLSRNQC